MSNEVLKNHIFNQNNENLLTDWDVYPANQSGKYATRVAVTDATSYANVNEVSGHGTLQSKKQFVMMQPIEIIERGKLYTFAIKKIGRAPIQVRVLKKNNAGKYFSPKSGVNIIKSQGKNIGKSGKNKNFFEFKNNSELEYIQFHFAQGPWVDDKSDRYALQIWVKGGPKNITDIEYVSMYAGEHRAEVVDLGGIEYDATSSFSCNDIDTAPALKVEGVVGVTVFNPDNGEQYFEKYFNDLVNGWYIPEEVEDGVIRWKSLNGENLALVPIDLYNGEEIYSYITKTGLNQWSLTSSLNTGNSAQLKFVAENSTPTCPWDLSGWRNESNVTTFPPSMAGNFSIKAVERDATFIAEIEGPAGPTGEEETPDEETLVINVSGDNSDAASVYGVGMVDFNGRYTRSSTSTREFRHTQYSNLRIYYLYPSSSYPSRYTGWILNSHTNTEDWGINGTYWKLDGGSNTLAPELKDYPKSGNWENDGGQSRNHTLKLSITESASSGTDDTPGNSGPTGEDEETLPDTLVVANHPHTAVNGNYTKQDGTVNGKSVYLQDLSTVSSAEQGDRVIVFKNNRWGFTTALKTVSLDVFFPFMYGSSNSTSSDDPRDATFTTAVGEGGFSVKATEIQIFSKESGLTTEQQDLVNRLENPQIKLNSVAGEFGHVEIEVDTENSWGIKYYQIFVYDTYDLSDYNAEFNASGYVYTDVASEPRNYDDLVRFGGRESFGLPQEAVNNLAGRAGDSFDDTLLNIVVKVVGYASIGAIESCSDVAECTIKVPANQVADPRIDNLGLTDRGIPYEGINDNCPPYLDVSVPFQVEVNGQSVADPTLNTTFSLVNVWRGGQAIKGTNSTTWTAADQQQDATLIAEQKTYWLMSGDGSEQPGGSINHPRPYWTNKQPGDDRRYILWHPQYANWVITGKKMYKDVLFVSSRQLSGDDWEHDLNETCYNYFTLPADKVAEIRSQNTTQTSEEDVLDIDGYNLGIAYASSKSRIHPKNSSYTGTWPDSVASYVYLPAAKQIIRTSTQANTGTNGHGYYKYFKFPTKESGITSSYQTRYSDLLAEANDFANVDATEPIPVGTSATISRGDSLVSDVEIAKTKECIPNYNFYDKQKSHLDKFVGQTGTLSEKTEINVIKGWTILHDKNTNISNDTLNSYDLVVEDNAEPVYIHSPELGVVADPDNQYQNSKIARHLYYDDEKFELDVDNREHLNSNLGTTSSGSTYLDWRHLHTENEHVDGTQILRENGQITVEEESTYMFLTPLLDIDQISNYNDDYAAFDLFKRDHFEFKFRDTFRSLKPNTEYKIRFGSWNTKTQQKVRFWCLDHKTKKFVPVRVTWIEIDGVNKALVGNNTHLKPVLIEKTATFVTGGHTFVPTLFGFRQRHNDVLSSVSISPTKALATTQSNPVKVVKSPTTNKKKVIIPTTNKTGTGPTQTKNLVKQKLNQGKIVKVDKHKDVSISETITPPLDKNKKYRLEIINPTSNAYHVNFANNTNFDNYSINYLTADGQQIQGKANGIHRKTGWFVKQELTFKTKQQVMNTISIDLGGELVSNFNFKEVTKGNINGWKWFTKRNGKWGGDDIKLLDFGQGKPGGRNPSKFMQTHKVRELRITRAFYNERKQLKGKATTDIFRANDMYSPIASLVDEAHYRCEIKRSKGGGNTRLKFPVTVSFLNESLKSIPFKVIVNRAEEITNPSSANNFQFSIPAPYNITGVNDTEANLSFIFKFDDNAEKVKYIRCFSNYAFQTYNSISVTAVYQDPTDIQATMYGGYTITEIT